MSLTEKDEKYKKNQMNLYVNICKSIPKYANEHSQNDVSPKEEYINVRAKRGQAPNSHSLAERVRRERISERLRFLQNLVPGCNKIMGKAVMLDEIINYVQALQRQVELLLVMLAAVSPDFNFHIEHILSKNMFLLRQGDSALLACSPRISTPYPPLCGSTTVEFVQTELVMCDKPTSGDILTASIPQMSALAQISTVWNGGLQNRIQTDFNPDLPPSCTELTDLMGLNYNSIWD